MYHFYEMFKIQIKPLHKLFLCGCFKIQGLRAIQRTSKCFYEPTPFKAQHAHSVSTSDTCVMGFLPTKRGLTREVTSLNQLQLTFLLIIYPETCALLKTLIASVVFRGVKCQELMQANRSNWQLSMVIFQEALEIQWCFLFSC